MTNHGLRLSASLAAIGAALLSMPANAQSRRVTTPNVSTGDAATSVTLNGTTFTNGGIVGAGRLDANTRDFRGETLGSFSGTAIDLATWRRNADGSYSSTMTTLPDRGPFDGGIDYRDRVHTESILFNPLATGSGALLQSTASQRQLTITPTGGFTLKDATGVEFTGRDPGASTVTRGGIVHPLATDGTAAGHIALDPEAIASCPTATSTCPTNTRRGVTEATHPVHPLPAYIAGEQGPEPAPPEPHRLVADADAALEQQILDIPR